MRVTNTHYYFWSGTFSNWHPAVFIYKGNIFHNSEQAYMWEKAQYFQNYYTARLILNEKDPKMAKHLGRSVKNFDPDKWAEVSYDIMVDVNIAKYTQNPLLANELLSTQEKVLVEASPYDKIWGVGLKETDDLILDERNWLGQNLLGKTLGDVRALLREIEELNRLMNVERMNKGYGVYKESYETWLKNKEKDGKV